MNLFRKDMSHKKASLPSAARQHLDQLRLSCICLAILLFYPSVSFAQVTTAGGMFCNVFQNAGGLPFFISAVAYIVGGAIFIRGVFDLVKRSSDPNTPLRNGLLGILVGSGIVSMPWLVQWLHTTIYGNISTGYSNFTCRSDGGTAPGSPIPLDEMLANFVANIFNPIIMLISILAIISGAFLIFYNMVKLSKLGVDGKAQTLTPILTSLIVGAMLMAVGQTLTVSLNTLFGGDSIVQYSSIAYDPGGSFDLTRFNRAMTAVFAFLYIIGLISFVRGFMILKNAMEGNSQQTKGQAFTHIIGGTLLVNMPGFIQIIEQTTGIDIIT
jgi:hypothetical protein